MGKRLKTLVIICIICIYGIFFTSCEYIDDLRSNRVVFVDDEEGRKIINNGKTYVRLEGMEDYYDVKKTESIRITKADVPVLLSKTYGYNASYSEPNDMFIFLGEIYCPEDKYDYYMDYDREKIFDVLITGFKEQRVLTASETELIYKILNDDSMKKSIDAIEWSSVDYSISFDICNSDRTLYSKDSISVTYHTRSGVCALYVRHRVKDGEYSISECYMYEAQGYDKRDLWNLIKKYSESYNRT